VRLNTLLPHGKHMKMLSRIIVNRGMMNDILQYSITCLGYFRSCQYRGENKARTASDGLTSVLCA